MPTATTLPLILLVGLLWKLTRGNTLAVVLFTSMFDAAAALNLGGNGLPCWLFAMLMCGMFKLFGRHRPLRLTPGRNALASHLLFLFIAYAAWTGMVHPFLFHGIPVLRFGNPTPLEWGVSNLTQLAYLGSAALLYVLSISSTRDELKTALTWYCYGCVMVSCVALYQLANAVVHVPYPDAILYSNKGHVIYHAYKINGMWRLNSTFPEASEMAFHIVGGITLIGWDVMTNRIRLGSVVALVLCLLCLLLSVSSLGYATFFFVIATASVGYAVYLVRQGGISGAKLTVAFVLAVGAVTLFSFANARATVGKVITSTLLDKKNTDSYKERSMTNRAALATAADSDYMGAGWGSVRASGLPYVLMGMVGVVGSAIFVLFVVSLFLPLLRRSPTLRLQTPDHLYEKSLFATIVMLVGLCVAGAEPVQPILWILFGVATVGRPLARALPARTEERRQHSLAQQYG
jgi:hypothetical protein